MDGATGAAAIFGAANAQHAQPRRHEVEDLTNRLANRVEWAAAAGTDALFNIDRHILTRQMLRERTLPQLRPDVGYQRGMAGLRPCKIGVEVFQPERKLIAIEPFRPPSKLRALQALDNEPEPLHLGPRRCKPRTIIGYLRGQLAHQTM